MTLLRLDRGLDSQLTARAITAHRLHDALEHNLDCLNVGYDRLVYVDWMNQSTASDRKIKPALNAIWNIHNDLRAHVRWEHHRHGLGSMDLYAPAIATGVGTIVVAQKNVPVDGAFYTAIVDASVQALVDLAITRIQLMTPVDNSEWLQANGWENSRPAPNNKLLLTRINQQPPVRYIPKRTVHECGQ